MGVWLVAVVYSWTLGEEQMDRRGLPLFPDTRLFPQASQSVRIAFLPVSVCQAYF